MKIASYRISAGVKFLTPLLLVNMSYPCLKRVAILKIGVIYCLLKKRVSNIHNHLYIERRDALKKISPKVGRLTEFRKVELDNPIVGISYNRPSSTVTNCNGLTTTIYRSGNYTVKKIDGGSE